MALEQQYQTLEQEKTSWLDKYRKQRRSLAARCQTQRQRLQAQWLVVRQRQAELDQKKRELDRSIQEVHDGQQRLLELSEALLRQHATLKARRTALYQWWSERRDELQAQQTELLRWREQLSQ